MNKNISACLFLGIISSAADAAVINYDEAINGDIHYATQYVGTLDVGTNTITGHASATATDITDLDAARVSLQDNQQITDIFLNLYDIQHTGKTTIGVSLDEYSGASLDSAFFHFEYVPSYIDTNSYDDFLLADDATSWSGSLFNSALPVSETGSYVLSNNSFTGYPLNAEYSYSWAIEVDYIVSPVPVPAALWLFVSGIVGLLGFSVKSKSSN